MALQASGPISFAQIAAEFGDTPPHALNEFYRGGAMVTANNTGVPASGAIAFGNFYGASRQFAFTIASNQINANLRTLAQNAGWDGSAPVVATINSGVWISGSVAGNLTAALTINGSFPNGVTLVNNGYIVGRGGTGGVGTPTTSRYGLPTAGQEGGRALLVQSAVTIQNNGYIAGGGGGGGASRYSSDFKECNMGEDSGSCYLEGSSGGGGRSNVSYTAPGGGGVRPGGTGTSSGPGAGASAATSLCSDCSCSCSVLTGGSGGQWGAAGATVYSGGGAAGQAVVGNSFITWTATGSRLGPIA